MKIYTDSNTGSDLIPLSANGPTAPFKTMMRAQQETMVAGDEFNLAGQQRGKLEPVSGASGNPTLYNNTGEVIGSVNHSHNEYVLDPAFQSFLQTWSGTSDADWVPDGWVKLSSTLTKETGTNLIGQAGARFKASAGEVMAQSGMDIPINSKARVRAYIENIAGAGGYFSVRVVGSDGTTSNPYLQDDLVTWGTFNTLPTPQVAGYQEFIIPFDTSSMVTQTGMQFDVGSLANDDMRLAAFYVEVLNEWTVFSGDTYQLPTTVNAQGVFTSSKAAWASSGFTGMVGAQKGTDQNSLNPGEFFFLSNVLYYRLASGQTDITDLHIESCFDRPVDFLNKNNITLSGGEYSGGLFGIVLRGTCSDIVLNDCHSHGQVSIGVYVLDSSQGKMYGGEINNCYNPLTPKGEGLQNVGATADFYAEGVYIHKIYDDCVQPNQGKTHLVGCTLISDFGDTTPGTCVEVDPTNADFIMDKCTLIQYNKNASFTLTMEDKTDGTRNVSYRDNIFIQNGIISNVQINNATTTGTRISSGNKFYGSGVQSGVVQGAGASEFLAGAVNEDQLVNEADPTSQLPQNSPGVGTGQKTWAATDPRPSGYNKEPYPDTKTDIGGAQSTWDANHPANL